MVVVEGVQKRELEMYKIYVFWFAHRYPSNPALVKWGHVADLVVSVAVSGLFLFG